MTVQRTASDEVEVSVDNIGGIDHTEVVFSSGVTVLTGRNATNRTSFLQALMAALGSDKASLKADADQGQVTLRIGDAVYTRRLVRHDGRVAIEGDPYLDDAEAADLFAFLLESNEARQAVVRGADLRDIIMRPIDTAAIRAEIDRLTDERESIRSELSELDSLKQRQTELEGRRTTLRQTVEEKREEVNRLRAELDDADPSIKGAKRETERLEETFEELNEVRSDLEDVRYEIETERESIEALEEEIADKEAELESLPEPTDDRIDDIESEIQRLRGREEELDSTLSRLQSVIQFNEEALDGMDGEGVPALHGTDGSEEDAITDRLLESDEVTCWTCGSVVERTQISDTLDELRDLRREKRQTRNEVQSNIRDLETERSEIKRERERRGQLTGRIDRAESEIATCEQRIDDLKARRAELQERIEELETTVDEFENTAHEEVLDRHKEVNEVEFELQRKESQLEDVEAELARIDDRLDEEDDLRDQLEDVKVEIEERRTRIERIESEAIEEFNSHMDELLDVLNYENIERIWIERQEVEVRDGRQTTTEPTFDLHVVRQNQSGSVYEDTVDHLSESEREVTGLVFALAGYLVHDLHEEVPFMLLDSLEAVDADRIASLVEYFDEYTRNLVLALLTEDAAKLDETYQRITSI